MVKDWRLFILLCAAPLILAIPFKTYWNDEYYSLLFSQNLIQAWKYESHFILPYVLLMPFTTLFGSLTHGALLVNITCFMLGLYCLWALGKKHGSVAIAQCLVMVVALNPIVVVFARSLRMNITLILFPIFLCWILSFLQGKTRLIALFLVTIFFQLLFYINIPLTFLTLGLFYWYLARNDDGVLNKKDVGASLLATASVALILYWRHFVEIPHELTVHRGDSSLFLIEFPRYLGVYAYESFTIDWKVFRHYFFLDYGIYIYLAFALLLNFWNFLENKKRALLIFSLYLIGLLLFWMLFFLKDMPWILWAERNHLYVLAIFITAMGISLGSVKNNIVRYSGMVFVFAWYCYTAHFIGLYRKFHNEEFITRKAYQHALDHKVPFIYCSFQGKIRYILNNEVEDSDCTLSHLQEMIESKGKIVYLDEFFSPEWRQLKNHFENNHYEIETVQSHYSKYYIIKKARF